MQHTGTGGSKGESSTSGKSTTRHKSSKARSSKGKPAKQTDPEIDVSVAVYWPRWGNYYHWAFVLQNSYTAEWDVYEAAQDEEDGPYYPNHLSVNPTNSRRCLLPLVPLVSLDLIHKPTIDGIISEMRVPGQAAAWNCQDYVMDIWEVMYMFEMVSLEEYEYARERLMQFYGQDFGGMSPASIEEEEEEARESEPGRVLSDEFVYDSEQSEVLSE